MQDKDFDMRLKRAECPVKVAEIADKTIRAVYLTGISGKRLRKQTDGFPGGYGFPEVSGGTY